MQDKIIDDLGNEMDSTSNRLDFVQVCLLSQCLPYAQNHLQVPNNKIKPFLYRPLQKKVAVVMKKASAKGQLMMILFLVALFIILFVLVFLT